MKADNWHDEYKKKLVTAAEAVKLVKSGDQVHIGLQHNPELLIRALWDRRNELRDVQIRGVAPEVDPGWWQPGSEKHFSMVSDVWGGNLPRPMLDAHLCDFMPNGYGMQFKIEERPNERRDVNVFMTVVSPPDKHGFCSFGPCLWYKKLMAQQAKKVIVEVDANYARTYGDNFIHVSEIDYFVENTLPQTEDEIAITLSKIKDVQRREKLRKLIDQVGSRASWLMIPQILNTPTEGLDVTPSYLTGGAPSEIEKRVCELVASLVHDGDTVQLGVGMIGTYLMDMGFLDNKLDLGVHTENAARGMVRLVKGGVINGKRKTLHPGKVVATAYPLQTWEDIRYIDSNPQFEAYSSTYVINAKTIAAHENMVSINNAMSVDFTGQIAAETTFGGRLIYGPGGLIDFHVGAVLSKGGRAIIALPSTALGGTISTIVPQFDQGMVVSIGRHWADYVVTEYGIARLMGKTIRERADALISISHPDFRSELKKEAYSLFYP